MKQIKIPKYLKITSPKESEPTYQFQGQSARSQHWFDIYLNWIKDQFVTREPDF